MSGGMYTWTNGQSHPTLEKLDRVLMSSDWEDIFPQVNIRKLVIDVSDHNALLLSSDNHVVRSPQTREFIFELSWLKSDEFLPLVEKIWNQYVKATDLIDILNIKLKRFKKFFKGWGSNKFDHERIRKKKIREELRLIEEEEEKGNMGPGIFCKKTELLVELNEILINEELFLLQQSRERWLLKGDSNTAYYQKIANGYKRKNTIHSMNVGDVTIEGTDNILRHATDFYKSLFGPSPGNLFLLDPEIWRITRD